jgi:uncharacterized protein YbbK (DUF523 family)
MVKTALCGDVVLGLPTPSRIARIEAGQKNYIRSTNDVLNLVLDALC